MPELLKRLNKHPCLTIFLLALTLRLAALAADSSYLQKPLQKDASVYDELALSVLAGKGLVFEGKTTAIAPPLYPLFLAGIYKMSGSSRLAVLLVQALLGSLVAVFLFSTGKILFSSSAGWFAAVFAAFYWPFIIIGMTLKSESFFIFLEVAGIYYSILSVKSKRPFLASIAGLFMGLAALTRPIIIYFPVLVIIKLAWDYYHQKDNRLIFAGGSFLIIFSLTYAPWVIRNYLVFNELIASTTNSGMVLYTGNFPYKGKILGRNLREGDLAPEERYLLLLPEIEKDRALKELALKKLKARPGHFAKMLLFKTAYFWSPFDWEVLNRPEGTFNPWFFWVLFFSLFWLFHLHWRPDLIIPMSLVVYIMAMCLVTYGSPRLRLPIEPFLILFASQGWLELEMGMKRKTVFIIGLGILVTIGLGYFYGFDFKEFCASLLSRFHLW